jgi:hypothetical protein
MVSRELSSVGLVAAPRDCGSDGQNRGVARPRRPARWSRRGASERLLVEQLEPANRTRNTTRHPHASATLKLAGLSPHSGCSARFVARVHRVGSCRTARGTTHPGRTIALSYLRVDRMLQAKVASIQAPGRVSTEFNRDASDRPCGLVPGAAFVCNVARRDRRDGEFQRWYRSGVDFAATSGAGPLTIAQ